MLSLAICVKLASVKVLSEELRKGLLIASGGISHGLFYRSQSGDVVSHNRRRRL